MEKISQKYLADILALWSSPLSYDEVKKKEAHKRAKRLLRMLGLMIGLTPDQFTVRSNLAGPAVSGEATLHSEPLSPGAAGIYVQIGQCYPFVSGGGSILYRTCRDRADYSGGQNWWQKFENVFKNKESMEAFASLCRKHMKGVVVLEELV